MFVKAKPRACHFQEKKTTNRKKREKPYALPSKKRTTKPERFSPYLTMSSSSSFRSSVRGSNYFWRTSMCFLIEAAFSSHSFTSKIPPITLSNHSILMPIFSTSFTTSAASKSFSRVTSKIGLPSRSEAAPNSSPSNAFLKDFLVIQQFSKMFPSK